VIDVVIPVYKGLEQTRACIESVLATKRDPRLEVVVVDDATPDPAIAQYLRGLSEQGRITLLANEANLGFVQSVNRGMALHADRDVVLLNSDTEVANDWLARLDAAAHSGRDVGTVTPFSNNATICSYPYEGWKGGLPGMLGLAKLDALFAKANARRTIELPTAVGFCMYIRRDCLAAIGAFDAERFGRGYGEENDFCMRAGKAGWRNILAADVFVYHEGSVSFSDERFDLVKAAAPTLIALHPEYPLRVHEFVERDEAGALRAAVDRARSASGAEEASAVLEERIQERAEIVHELMKLLQALLELRGSGRRDAPRFQPGLRGDRGARGGHRGAQVPPRREQRRGRAAARGIEPCRDARLLAPARARRDPLPSAVALLQLPAAPHGTRGAVSEALERLARSRLPRVLFVSHAFGGGVGRHIEDLAGALEGDAEILLAQPYRKSFIALRWLRAGEQLALWFHTADDWERMVQLLGAIGIDRVHFHHVHGWPQAVLDLPARLACPYDITLHDFFPACPEYHFTAADARFCGGAADCQRCLEARPAQWPLTIDAWRSLFARVLGGAGRVIAPSGDAASRLHTFFPAVRTEVWPHLYEPASQPAAPMRILVPGAISPEKGLGLLEACVADAAERGLPLHFRVLGYTARPIPQWPLAPYSLTGEYPRGASPSFSRSSAAMPSSSRRSARRPFRTRSRPASTRRSRSSRPTWARCPSASRAGRTRASCRGTAPPARLTTFSWSSRRRGRRQARNADAVSAAGYRARYAEALPSQAKSAARRCRPSKRAGSSSRTSRCTPGPSPPSSTTPSAAGARARSRSCATRRARPTPSSKRRAPAPPHPRKPIPHPPLHRWAPWRGFSSADRGALRYHSRAVKKLPARWIPKMSINTWLRVGAGLAVVFAFFMNEVESIQLRFIQQMELLAYDQRLRFFMPRTLDTRVVILDIDEKSLNAEGRWPWSRDKVALMVRQLFDTYGVRVVGFDIAFAEADTSSGLTTLDLLAQNELKNDPEYLAALNQKRASLDYDQIFADEIKKHPWCWASSWGARSRNRERCPRRCSTTAPSATRAGWSSTTWRRGTAATSRSCRRTPPPRATSTPPSTSTAWCAGCRCS
jgi:GT2 family glycosyltransferase